MSVLAPAIELPLLLLRPYPKLIVRYPSATNDQTWMKEGFLTRVSLPGCEGIYRKASVRSGRWCRCGTCEWPGRCSLSKGHACAARVSPLTQRAARLQLLHGAQVSLSRCPAQRPQSCRSTWSILQHACALGLQLRALQSLWLR